MEQQTAVASSLDDGIATSNNAQDAVGDTGSLSWQKQGNTEPRCSTIRRKTSRARMRYFNDMLSDDALGATPCDTVRRRRQKSAAQWQRGTGLAAADETDSGIALTPEWELLPQAWSRVSDDRPTATAVAAAEVENRRAQQLAAAGGPSLLLQAPPLKVPSAARWGEAFDTMVAQLRCKLPASTSDAINDDDSHVARADSELRGGETQAVDSDAGSDGLCNGSSNVGGCRGGESDVQRTVAAEYCSRGGEQLWTGGGDSSESGSCCSRCCAAMQCNHCHSSTSSCGSESGGGGGGGSSGVIDASTRGGSAVGCQTTAVAFRDIIYRRTGRSLTIDIAPSIVKTASNNDVWIKLRNDQEDSSVIKKASNSRRAVLPQQPLHRTSLDASNRKSGDGNVKMTEQGSGRWQKLRKLFSVKVNKKERSQGHVRVMLKNGGGHLD